jgi:hypothetical protein
MNYSWYSDQDPANELADPEIETVEIIERIYDEAPDELTQIADMIRIGKDSDEAVALFRELMSEYEKTLIEEIRNGR